MTSVSQPALPCAIYVRVSTPGQEREGTSLETQEAEATVYAAKRGYHVMAIYRETFSGAALWERPELTKLRAEVRAGKYQVFVVHALDRLSRDQNHVGILLDELERHGCKLELVTETFEDTPVGRFIIAARAFAAETERAKIQERTQRGIRHRVVEQGRPLLGPKPPVGYGWNALRTGYVIEPEGARLVRRLFELALAGHSLRDISRILAAEGIPTPAGHSLWRATSVRWVLANPVYTGHPVMFRRQHMTRYENGRKKRSTRERPAEEQHELRGAAPALVSEEAFAAIGARLQRNRELSARNLRNPEAFLLRGFLRCAHCDSAMVAANQRYRPTAAGEPRSAPTYKCGRHVNIRECTNNGIVAATVDQGVWDRLRRALGDRDEIARQVKLRRQQDPTQHDLAAVESSLKDVARQQAKLTRTILAVDDEDGAAPLAAELRRLGERKRALEAERAAVTARRAGWMAAEQRLDDIEAWCEAVGAELDAMDFAGRRQALEAFNVRVRLHRPDAGRTPRWEIEADINLALVSSLPGGA